MALDFVSTVRPYLWFGSYPSQERINLLENAGTRLFVNLTLPSENLVPYSTNYMYMHIPIEDNSVPDSISVFCFQLIEIVRYILAGASAYIHCRGGHGRSGMVSAILLCLIEGLAPKDSISEITYAHKSRPNIREFWKKCQCPHLHNQRKFIFKLFSPHYILPTDDFKGPKILESGFSPIVCKCKMPLCLGSRKPPECSEKCVYENACAEMNYIKIYTFTQR
jgi:protein-tyrosine phosphatase